MRKQVIICRLPLVIFSKWNRNSLSAQKHLFKQNNQLNSKLFVFIKIGNGIQSITSNIFAFFGKQNKLVITQRWIRTEMIQQLTRFRRFGLFWKRSFTDKQKSSIKQNPTPLKLFDVWNFLLISPFCVFSMNIEDREE